MGLEGRRGLQPQEGLDLLSLVHSLVVGKGDNPTLCPVTACLHCLLSLFPFKIYSMGKAASLGIGSSSSARANVTPTYRCLFSAFLWACLLLEKVKDWPKPTEARGKALHGHWNCLESARGSQTRHWQDQHKLHTTKPSHLCANCILKKNWLCLRQEILAMPENLVKLTLDLHTCSLNSQGD